MAKYRSTQLIPPFPDDINRQRFGDWLSGFTDGEVSFTLFYKKTPTKTRVAAFFLIRLRDDDTPILRLVQQFFGCGTIHPHNRGKGNGNPAVGFQIRTAAALQEIVVPHFEAHPLRAKKSRDFEIWKRAVAVLYRVTRRRRIGYQTGRGCHPRWRPEEHDEFAQLCADLKQARRYKSTQP